MMKRIVSEERVRSWQIQSLSNFSVTLEMFEFLQVIAPPVARCKNISEKKN